MTVQILGASWTDALPALIAIVTAPLAVVALFQTRSSLRAQALGADLQTVLSLLERLDELWVRFRGAKSDADKEFEFGQLTSYYELACGLFGDGMLSTKAARTLKEHLRDVLPVMLAHPSFAKRFEELTSCEDTFENIRWFVANHAKAVTNAAP